MLCSVPCGQYLLWLFFHCQLTGSDQEKKQTPLASFTILTFQRIPFRNGLLTMTSLTDVREQQTDVADLWRSQSNASFLRPPPPREDDLIIVSVQALLPNRSHFSPSVKEHLSILRHSWCAAALILSWASAWVMDSVPKPSIARMTSPGHRLAAAALLPGVIWKKSWHHLKKTSALCRYLEFCAWHLYFSLVTL